MPIDLQVLCRELKPSTTSILFGAGSSIPSGGPSGTELGKSLCESLHIDYDPSLPLADIGTLIEIKHKRRDAVNVIRGRMAPLKPTTGLLNLPLYDWKDIFTTNYDTLIEQTYKKAGRALKVYSSNFDFDESSTRNTTSLYKLHGTLDNDRSHGHQSSMIISNEDYELATEYRELLFDRFLHETSRNDVLIIGHSLADPDLNSVLNEALRRKRKSGAIGRLFALVFSRDDNRAKLLEQRGYSVCFGSVDDFFANLHIIAPEKGVVYLETGEAMDRVPQLKPVTIDVSHSLEHDRPDPVRLFNGGAAKYGDINADLTFRRDLAGQIETQLADDDKPIAYILGPAGFGKSTIARQVATSLSKRSFLCWEHKNDYRFEAESWIKIAQHCQTKKINALLVVDEAHSFLRQLDQLFDYIYNNELTYFRIVLISSPARWHPRTKSPSLYQIGVEYSVNRLSQSEITSLLDLFERRSEISSLVEASFSGFSRNDKLRRLSDRCKSDMFVCMKNIFGFDKLDDIILREYTEIDEDLQNVYRTVAAMEASQIKVHRQLVMRVLGIKSGFVDGILTMLKDIVEEYTVDDRNGIYAWRGRHPVISEIILKYKYSEDERLFKLYSNVIDFINPTYEIEQLTIREMCDVREGVGRLKDRTKQNYLFRKMISVAPFQRVPRHRLISNLISDGEFEPASNEIRIFEKELRTDPPIVRYKAMILIARSRKGSGLLNEDRLVMLDSAKGIVDKGLERFGYDRGLHSTNLEIGIDNFKITGSWLVFDNAIERLKRAEQQYLDPEMNRMLSRYKAQAESVARGDRN